MAPSHQSAKYQYVLTTAGPKIVPVPDQESKDEESPADYNAGGYLQVKVNDEFKSGRYRVLRKLGWGHFSTVWLVKDLETNRHSALKVVKSAGRYAETARDEIKLLSRVSQASITHPGRHFVVSLLDSFSHIGPESSHVCIVFEPLGENLLALIERHKKKGVSRPLVKVIVHQVLLGLSYLHDECDLVHTDIKPENIMISIPDIESHILNELTLCPSPTSRRVGVPLATKTRAGVSIPYSHPGRATRRQVQIFDSQPLPSPGRGSLSGGKSANNSASASISTSAGKPNSVNMMHMSRIASSTGLSGPRSTNSGTTPALVSKTKPTTEPPHAPAPTSPSTSTTSSSSHSIASAAAVSTPATSVSHGSALCGDIRNTITVLDTTCLPTITEPISFARGPVQKEDVCAELASAMSTSWKYQAQVGKEHAATPGPSPPASWKDKVATPSLVAPPWKSKVTSPSLISSSAARNKPSSSSPLSSLRNDPIARLVGSTATPAPAVVVSASVSVSHTGPVVLGGNSKHGYIQPDATVVAKPDAQPSLLTQTAPRDRSHCTKSSSTSSTTRHDQLLNSISASAAPHTPLSSSTITPASGTPTLPSPPPSPVGVPSPPSPPQDLISVPPISVKIADLGNATPSKRHFTEDIQTRQYRAPEAIVGRRDWDARVDVWSMACMAFELLTAEYLFDPQGQGELFNKDDDHMAQIIELLGDFPLEAKMGGKYSRELFDHTGGLRYIKTLKPWPLKRVMTEKYLYNEPDADALCAFLEPMLATDFRNRKSAHDMVDHPWLEVTEVDGEVGEW